MTSEYFNNFPNRTGAFSILGSRRQNLPDTLLLSSGHVSLGPSQDFTEEVSGTFLTVPGTFMVHSWNVPRMFLRYTFLVRSYFVLETFWLCTFLYMFLECSCYVCQSGICPESQWILNRSSGKLTEAHGSTETATHYNTLWIWSWFTPAAAYCFLTSRNIDK